MGKRADFEELRDLTRLLVGRVGRLESRADEVATRLEQLQTRATPDVAIDYWLEERVLALAVHRARSIGVERAEWSEAEAAIRERAKAAATIQDLALMQVTRALQKEGIPSVVLKGAPMARRLYGEAELRAPSGDLDLLVPVEQLDAASAVVIGLGWAAANDARYAGGLPNHHWAHAGPNGMPAVELHWRVQWYEQREHSRLILERAEPFDGLSVASPLDQLSVLLLAFGRDGFHHARIAADVAACWDRWEDDALPVATLWQGPLARPHAFTAAAVAAVMDTPAPPRGALGDRSARSAGALARADEPVTHRTAFTQVAVVDLLCAPRGLRRRRALATWLRSPEYLAARYPRLSSRVGVRVLRGASALRTVLRVPQLAARAARSRG